MKLAYGIFIGIGVTIFGFLVVVTVLSLSSGAFLKEQEPFIRAFTFEYSKTWDPYGVEDTLSNSMLTQLQTPNGIQAIQMLKMKGSSLYLYHLT